jgi:hypothetical protein
LTEGIKENIASIVFGKNLLSKPTNKETKVVKTRDGFDLDISYTNQVWQCDHTLADILLVDRNGELSEGGIVERPCSST